MENNKEMIEILLLTKYYYRNEMKIMYFVNKSPVTKKQTKK